MGTAALKRTMQSLYVHRPLLNGEEVVAWAKANGFETTLLPDDMHVTIAYSTDKVDWDSLDAEKDQLVVRPGIRSLERFDAGAVVLSFFSAALTKRWQEFKDAGAAWSYPDYLPHITLSYKADDLDLKKITPFAASLVFGPEVFKTIKTGNSKPAEKTVKIEALLLAQKSGITADQIRFSEKLEWTDHDGVLRLSKAVADPRTKQITLFINALEVRHPKSTVSETLAVLAQCIKALGDGHWDEDEHPRDHDGKFTFSGGDANDGGGVEFVSPSVADHMDFSQAVSALNGKQQAALKAASDYIDAELKLPGAVKDVVGAWSDGAENSVANFHGNTKWTDWSKIVTAASMKGHLADQKSVLVFQEKPIRKPRESVVLKGQYPHGLGTIDLTVEVNPTGNELRRMASEFPQIRLDIPDVPGGIRILIDADGNLYAWDASKAIHAQVSGALDLDVRYQDFWYAYGGRLISDKEAGLLTAQNQVRQVAAGVAEVREKLASLNGDSVLLSFEATGSLEDIHKNLLSDGLAFHSLIPHDGGATVYAAVVDPKEVKATVAAVKQAAERYGSKVTYRAGRGEFIGDKLGTGSDREQRDRARSVYEGNIRRSDVHGSQAIWQSVRDRWGSASNPEALAASFDPAASGRLFREWDESKHPRDPGGEDGGQFVDAGGDDEGDGPLSDITPGQRLTSNALIAEAGNVKPNSKKVTEVAKEINERAGKILKQDLGVEYVDLDNHTDKTDDYVAGVIARELKDGLHNGHSAVDWYDKSMKEAMDIAGKLYPGMATDPDKRFIYTAALAITSQGEVVDSSVRLADTAYRYFEEHGKFPTNIKAADPNITVNLKKVNAFVGKLGVAGTRELFDKQMTVRELKQLTGHAVSGLGMDDKVYGSAVLGPKIGQGFYQNLNGNFQPITMDLWFMRSWGRITNTGIGETNMVPVFDRFTNALSHSKKSVPKTREAQLNLAREIFDQHERDYAAHGADFKSGKRKKSELVLAAERLTYHADGAMVEMPKGAGHRRWITSVFHRALNKLKRAGTNLSPASAQATWWWPEKVLWQKLGVRVRELDTDYAKSLRKLALAQEAKKLDATSRPGFGPWIDDPDEPDYLTDEEIEAMAARAAANKKDWLLKSKSWGSRANVASKATFGWLFRYAFNEEDHPQHKMRVLRKDASDKAIFMQQCVQTMMDESGGTAFEAYDICELLWEEGTDIEDLY